jgi:carbon-monoxide dehydrogenase small subunit
MKKIHFSILVNDAPHAILCEPDETLLDVLRNRLGLTGTKRGCNIGACGSCTVLVNGKPKRSCHLTIGDVGIPVSELGICPTPPPLTKGRKLRPGSQVPGPEEAQKKLPMILTIEGLGDGQELHPIQQAFIDCGAIQCGFCTPGMVLATKALLDANPHPTRDEIRWALRANLCRCTGYQQIFEAVEAAAVKMRAQEGEHDR